MHPNLDRSRELYEEAVNLLPGGVSSPVRAFKPFPFYTARGKGSRIYDVDGNSYIDYCMGYGPLILGHSNDVVKAAIEEQLEKGWLFGTPVEIELRYAKLIRKLFPSIEMLRYVNTGSEATMAAIRAARGFTGRDKIVKVEGSFHGAHDAVLVKAGSGATTHGTPNSAGVPRDFVKNTLQVPFNDVESLTAILEKEEVAAFILEPVMGNSSLILPSEGYLKEVRKITEENDVVLIFDEVITGFRVSEGGAQKLYGVKPDLTTLGKIAGGGLPIGIFGGRREIMERISPSGDVYQAGTFSGNPLSLAAGYATVKYLVENRVLERVNGLTDTLVKGLSDLAPEDVKIGSIASMFCIYFGETPRNYSEALKLDKELYMKFFWNMLLNGVFLPPSQFETCFVSYAHSEEDIDKTIDAFESSVRSLG